MVSILTSLKKKAMEFESRNGKDKLGIGIINIGHVIDPVGKPKDKAILEKIGVETSFKGIGNYEPFFELTKDGEAINLNEYACWIADTRKSPSD